MIEKIKDKTFEEIRSDYKLTDQVIFKSFVDKFKTQCMLKIFRDISFKTEILNKLTVGDDVEHILKYYGGELDYSEVETKPIDYVGKIKISHMNWDQDYYIDIYRQKTEDDILVEKNQADPILISHGLEIEDVKLKAELNPDEIADNIKSIANILKSRKV